ncbi:hypothetical protein FJ692_15575 [Pseudomonas fluorescens]|nr:hypothetical protein C1751_15545 [Pseudomonas fluorescens]TPV56282.1 hypothetical protein FJ692_15575 [Pseudomonas fluorescens]
MIIPTLCVVTPLGTLCVPLLRADAERPCLHSHAERGNDHRAGSSFKVPWVLAVTSSSLKCACSYLPSI